MKAIVLTCDRYRAFTEHMVRCYQRLWPDHPFVFRIPYQEDRSLAPEFAACRIEWVQTPKNIRDTVLHLLRDIDDEEFIFWCLDDKYVTWLRSDVHRDLASRIAAGTLTETDGISTCRCRTLWNPAEVEPASSRELAGLPVLRRRTYTEIWLHQFVRAKVIRHLFEEMPADIPAAKVMDGYIESISLPDTFRLHVTPRSLASYGESTTRGTMTYNCFRSMQRAGVEPPASFAVAKQSIHMGIRHPWLEFLAYSYGLQSLKLFLLHRVYVGLGLQRIYKRLVYSKASAQGSGRLS
jgi:hypothetical protein